MKRITLLLLTFSLGMSASAQDTRKLFPPKKQIYHKGWIDFNKNGRKDVYEDPTRPLDERVEDLLSQMNLNEKTCQLATFYGYKKALRDSVPTTAWLTQVLKDGIANIDEHLNREIADPALLVDALSETQRFFVEYTRLGIPADFTNEGIRGLCATGATSFPSVNAMGCTWNPALSYQQGVIEGSEARALGYTNVYAPILDVARDQRWGRWEGTFGEDPFLVARMGVAMAQGLQSQRVVSSPKHYVGYGDCKAARQWDARTDPHVTPSEMYYIHEYPFRKVFAEAGALGVMCAYNDFDGVPMAGSYHYLTEVLRGEMGFKGYVVSDSYAIGRLNGVHKVSPNFKESARMAVEAGLNVRTEFNDPTEYITHVRHLVQEGRLSEAVVNQRVREVLRVKFWLGLFDNPYTGSARKARQVVSSDHHLQTALQASRECLVLLKNDSSLLPLKNKFRRIAVIGPNADSRDYVPTHYGPTRFQRFVSVLGGLRSVYAGTDVNIEYAKGIDIISRGWPESELVGDTLTAAERASIAQAVSLARRSDVAIVVLGDNQQTSGESRTRSSLDLPGHQEALLRAVVKTGKPVVLVLIWGRPATINFAARRCPAILAAGFPGAQGGQAIAEALKGDYNPGGKLNGTWPKTVGQLPMNIPTKPNANWEPLKYYSVANKGLLWCFGHGLSYTTFRYDSLRIDSTFTHSGHVRVTCRVSNTGAVAGDEVVQLYLNDVVSSTTTYEKNLRGFQRISLQPGQSRTVSFSIVPDDLVLINARKERVVEPGEFKVMVGSSYDDIRLSASFYYRTGGVATEPLRSGNGKMINEADFNPALQER